MDERKVYQAVYTGVLDALRDRTTGERRVGCQCGSLPEIDDWQHASTHTTPTCANEEKLAKLRKEHTHLKRMHDSTLTHLFRAQRDRAGLKVALRMLRHAAPHADDLNTLTRFLLNRVPWSKDADAREAAQRVSDRMGELWRALAVADKELKDAEDQG